MKILFICVKKSSMGFTFSQKKAIPLQYRKIVEEVLIQLPNLQFKSPLEIKEQLNVLFEKNRITGMPLDLTAALALVYSLCVKLEKRFEHIHKPYPIQLVAALALYEGKVLHMENGEGKTLVAAIAAILRAKQGHSVHISTQNNYLVKRDATWMWPLYDSVGVKVTIREEGVQHGQIIEGVNKMHEVSVAEAYRGDVLYSHRKRFGFDFLEDNMTKAVEKMVQKGHDYIIIDEIDSTLIDSAREELRISIVPESQYFQKRKEIFKTAWSLVQRLEEDKHFSVENKDVLLTEEGINFCEFHLRTDIYRDKDVLWSKIITLALKAKYTMVNGEDYLCEYDSVYPIDEFTNRPQKMSSYSGGLQQALELKEGVSVRPETITRGVISIQNFYKNYSIISGMSGSVWPIKKEIEAAYGLKLLKLPQHLENQRNDKELEILIKESYRNSVAVKEAIREFRSGRPVLVGVEDDNTANTIYQLIQKEGVVPYLLTANDHAREAEVINKLGETSSIMISAKLAGRGTDIRLSEELLQRGGLHVIVVGLMEERIENQLRGRAGRKGQPGSSSCYISIDDKRLQHTIGKRARKILERINLDEDETLVHPWITKSIERVRESEREYDFRQRRGLFEADLVLEGYRHYIYSLRLSVLNEHQENTHLFSTISDNVIERNFEQQRKQKEKSLDLVSEKVIDSLCLKIEGLSYQNFTGVGKSKGWKPRKESIKKSFRGFLQEMHLTVIDKELNPIFSVSNLLLKMSIRDVIDEVWGDFIRLYEEEFKKSFRHNVRSTWRGRWIRIRTHKHFIDALASIELRAIIRWSEKMHLSESDILKQVMSQLDEENRWEDLVGLVEKAIIKENTFDIKPKDIAKVAEISVKKLKDQERSLALYKDAISRKLKVVYSKTEWEFCFRVVDDIFDLVEAEFIRKLLSHIEEINAKVVEFMAFVFEDLTAEKENRFLDSKDSSETEMEMMHFFGDLEKIIVKRLIGKMENNGEVVEPDWIISWMYFLRKVIGTKPLSFIMARVFHKGVKNHFEETLRSVVHSVELSSKNESVENIETLATCFGFDTTELIAEKEGLTTIQVNELITEKAKTKYQNKIEQLGAPLNNIFQGMSESQNAPSKVQIQFLYKRRIYIMLLNVNEVLLTKGYILKKKLEIMALETAILQFLDKMNDTPDLFMEEDEVVTEGDGGILNRTLTVQGRSKMLSTIDFNMIDFLFNAYPAANNTSNGSTN